MKDCECTQCAYSKKHPQLNAPRCWHVTADTITDEQIRELRERLLRTYWAGDRSVWDSINLCRHALAPYHVNPGQHASARARCAEILNAREAAR